MTNKKATQRKRNNEETNLQANVNHDKQMTKAHQQKQLTQREHLLDWSRFYGVVVSTLQFETKNPSSTLRGIFYQFLLDDVDYS